MFGNGLMYHLGQGLLCLNILLEVPTVNLLVYEIFVFCYTWINLGYNIYSDVVYYDNLNNKNVCSRVKKVGTTSWVKTSLTTNL